MLPKQTNQTKPTIPCSAQPLLTYLAGACAEFARVGLSTLPSQALVHATRALYASAVDAYAQLLHSTDAPSSSSNISSSNSNSDDGGGEGGECSGLVNASQNAYVQLLQDLWFLADVFAHARAHSEGSDVVEAVKTHDALTATCVEKIDPFDMNVYESHLRETRVHVYHQSATLLGYLTQLKPVHQQVR